MRLAQALLGLESWRNQVVADCSPLLGQARGALSAVQNLPDADSRIAQQEEQLVSAIDETFARAEPVLDSIRNAVSAFFEDVDEPTPEEQAAADRVDQADEQLRDWLTRKAASLVAQARARELEPIAATPAHASPPTVAPTDEPAIRPLRQARPTQVGYGSPDAIAERFGPPAEEPTLASATPARRFCTECGGPLGPEDGGHRRCKVCGRAV